METKFDHYLQGSSDRPHLLRRDIYTDPDIFEAEMKSIWEKTWIYLGHESQLRAPGDFLSTVIGRQPVILLRNKAMQLKAFINACRHRGATLCRTTKGNSKRFVCPYHSWTYNLDGALVGLKDERIGAYPDSFSKDELNLTPVPRMENYRGFVFGCLDPDVESLDAYLGSAKTIIDLLVDQGTDGLEVLKGNSTYVYKGNWKLQLENGVDGYHATSVHGNFMATMRNRQLVDQREGVVKAMAIPDDAEKLAGGAYDLGNGHAMIWADWSNGADRFNHDNASGIEERMGSVRAKWALGRLRNLLVYPSVFVMDQASTQIRIVRPISVDKTEVQIFCIAPVGEAADQRRKRIRYYEDFFNASGMATPDDLAEFEASQLGFRGMVSPWSDLSRGAGSEVAGADDHARELGLEPVFSGSWVDHETVFAGQYRQWRRLMSAELGGTPHD